MKLNRSVITISYYLTDCDIKNINRDRGYLESEQDSWKKLQKMWGKNVFGRFTYPHTVICVHVVHFGKFSYLCSSNQVFEMIHEEARVANTH